MDFYLDIHLEPDLEISAPALLNNLFAKFHRAMAQRCNGEIGVSFPAYHRYGLGDILRLHGSESALNTLMATLWLKGLRDYTSVKDIRAVPHKIKGYQTVYRVQQKSVDNKRKRSVRKGWLTEEEALQQISESQTRGCLAL